MNSTLEIIIKEMCKRAGADFNSMDFHAHNWFHEYEWTELEEWKFKNWLICFLRRQSIRNLEGLTKFPWLVKNDNNFRHKLAKEIISMWGWKIKNNT